MQIEVEEFMLAQYSLTKKIHEDTMQVINSNKETSRFEFEELVKIHDKEREDLKNNWQTQYNILADEYEKLQKMLVMNLQSDQDILFSTIKRLEDKRTVKKSFIIGKLQEELDVVRAKLTKEKAKLK